MFEGRFDVAMALAATLCASIAVAGQGQLRQVGGVGITVYVDIDFRGDNATFRSDEPDLGSSRFAGQISSLRVANGEMWEVCEGTNYRPPCQVFSGSESDLRRANWSDRISSLRRIQGEGNGVGRGGGIFPPGRPGSSAGGGLVLYSDDRFHGDTRIINGPTSSLGSWNDRAESFRITSGTWEVCEDIDFGKCRTVNRDYENLGALGLSKRISSVRPVSNERGGSGFPVRGPQLERLVLYDRDQYRGGARTLDGADSNLGNAGNRAQSIQVIGTWQLCEGPNFSGRCVTLSQNVPDLASYGLSNRVASARPLRGR